LRWCSAAGALLVQLVNTKLLDAIVPVVLSAIAHYFLFAPDVGSVDRRPRIGHSLYCTCILPVIGFYDGFFGPGTGSFFSLSGVSLRGWGLVRATASAKIFNLASSLASLTIFIYGDEIVWLVGGIMIAGQVIGSRLGASAVIAGGARLIRPVIVLVSFAMLARYAWQKGLL
jgi:uncharacterized protein